MASGPMELIPRDTKLEQGFRACFGQLRVDETQLHLRDESGYSANEGG